MNEEKNTKKKSMFSKPLTQSIIGIVVVFLVLGGFLYWQSGSGTLLIENSQISAPVINLSASTAGTLNALYVSEGDKISANTPVALVGTGIVTSKQSGIVINVSNNIGTFYSQGVTIISMIHPEDMRVIGAIDETKGLEKIKLGQQAAFTVDAFGNKTYVGIVESISQTSNDTGVVFSISDKRPTKKFDVKVRFNVADYPELKNGMSAKITVYTQ
ncbi:MAG: Multidrug resistance protein [Parcubacteria bacterium C7867-006]|nr:MAG: Multidrug resistance protein [Parcubacteria bacterium C7867-006]